MVRTLTRYALLLALLLGPIAHAQNGGVAPGPGPFQAYGTPGSRQATAQDIITALNGITAENGTSAVHVNPFGNPDSLYPYPAGTGPNRSSHAISATTSLGPGYQENVELFSMISNKGYNGGANNGAKVVLFNVLDMRVGTGDGWNYNSVLNVNPGIGNVSGTGGEIDINNGGQDFPGNPGYLVGTSSAAFAAGTSPTLGPVLTGWQVNGFSTHLGTAAFNLASSAPANGFAWQYGFWFGGPSAVRDYTIRDTTAALVSLEVQGTHAFGLDTSHGVGPGGTNMIAVNIATNQMICLTGAACGVGMSSDGTSLLLPTTISTPGAAPMTITPSVVLNGELTTGGSSLVSLQIAGTHSFGLDTSHGVGPGGTNMIAVNMAANQTICFTGGACGVGLSSDGTSLLLPTTISTPGAAPMTITPSVAFGGNLTAGGLVAVLGTLALKQITPATSAAACATGTIVDDANYHYACTASNHWRRVALADF